MFLSRLLHVTGNDLCLNDIEFVFTRQIGLVTLEVGPGSSVVRI